jgi:uncharacterized protein involved in response to NO
MTGSGRSAVPLLSLGFRPFFLAAAAYAVIAMSVWLAVYGFGLTADLHGLPTTIWHAHEMVFGYSLAVIAGFLLTAVKNWTGRPTLHGAALLLLFMFWLCARVAFYLPGPAIYAAAVFDTLFATYLTIGILRPILATRQWQQAGIVAKVVLMGAGNLVFYLGMMGIISQGIHWGLYTGFYLVIGLILTMSRRLIPFFVERGVGYAVELRNSGRLDIAALISFLVFFVVEVFVGSRQLSAALAGLLFILHLYRLSGWYASGIWRKPLLWSLYLAYALLTLGFGLFAASVWLDILWFPALHAFAVGGIGLITLSMMSRVSLGHTGRDINEPPRGLPFFLLVLLTAAIVRVLLPPLLPQFYTTWILVSQVLWITAFAGFVVLYIPILFMASKVSDIAH